MEAKQIEIIGNWFWCIFKKIGIFQSYGITAHWNVIVCSTLFVVLSEGIAEPSKNFMKVFALCIQQDIFNKWIFPSGGSHTFTSEFKNSLWHGNLKSFIQDQTTGM